MYRRRIFRWRGVGRAHGDTALAGLGLRLRRHELCEQVRGRSTYVAKARLRSASRSYIEIQGKLLKMKSKLRYNLPE